MLNEYVPDPIPLDIAIKLCDEIREEVDKIWYPTPDRWCYCCQQETGGDPTKRGFLREPGNRGCFLVNKRYAGIAHPKGGHRS